MFLLLYSSCMFSVSALLLVTSHACVRDVVAPPFVVNLSVSMFVWVSVHAFSYGVQFCRSLS